MVLPGSLMEELTKAVNKGGGEEDTIKDFDIDEYVVKTEMPEQDSEVSTFFLCEESEMILDKLRLFVHFSAYELKILLL